MYCAKCGAQLPDVAKFCRNCGTAVTVAQTLPGEDIGRIAELRHSEPPSPPAPPLRRTVVSEPSQESATNSSLLFSGERQIVVRESEGPAKQRYAWMLVGVPILSTTVYALLNISPGSEAYWVYLLATSVINTALFFADLSSNNGEMNPLRFIAAFMFVPIWLWMRGKALNAGRVPFWTYLVVLLLSTFVLQPVVQLGASSWRSSRTEPAATGIEAQPVSATVPEAGPSAETAPTPAVSQAVAPSDAADEKWVEADLYVQSGSPDFSDVAGEGFLYLAKVTLDDVYSDTWAAKLLEPLGADGTGKVHLISQGKSGTFGGFLRLDCRAGTVVWKRAGWENVGDLTPQQATDAVGETVVTTLVKRLCQPG